jgi:hypothetical protein
MDFSEEFSVMEKGKMFDIGCVKPADLPSLIYFGGVKSDTVNLNFVFFSLYFFNQMNHNAAPIHGVLFPIHATSSV